MALRSLRAWQLLIVSLPTQSSTARMRIWRALKALGCAPLRDGAYLLPAGEAHARALRALAQDCLHAGGQAWRMAVQAASEEEAQSYRALFDRSEEYASLRKRWKEANRALAATPAAELVRLQRRLEREMDAVQAIDYFPGEASVEAQAEWSELRRRIERLSSKDEPRGARRRIPRLDAGQYQGRTWATRRHLWVDRVASAWLIRRFIDRKARFLWLARPGDCPKNALGFDFDGARFTHAGELVTFETLMESFRLEGDPALKRLAAMVRQLDTGGESVPEGSGFEAMLAGARERLPDDDALLTELGAALDSLYIHFERESKRRRTRSRP